MRQPRLKGRAHIQRLGLAILITLALLGLAQLARATSAQPTPSQADTMYLPVLRQAEPTSTATATSGPTATATLEPTPTAIPPSTVAVRSHQSYPRGNALYVVGEVVNNLNRPVYFVNVEARFYNAANELVATQDTYAFLVKTEPDQRNPFRLLVSYPPADIDHYHLSVLSWQDSSVLDYRPITVLSEQTRDNFGVEVFGEVRNDQPGEMEAVRVAVTFYGAVDEVVNVELDAPGSTTLAPGATSVYSVKAFNSINFTKISVQAQGYLVP